MAYIKIAVRLCHLFKMHKNLLFGEKNKCLANWVLRYFPTSSFHFSNLNHMIMFSDNRLFSFPLHFITENVKITFAVIIFPSLRNSKHTKKKNRDDILFKRRCQIFSLLNSEILIKIYYAKYIFQCKLSVGKWYSSISFPNYPKWIRISYWAVNMKFHLPKHRFHLPVYEKVQC